MSTFFIGDTHFNEPHIFEMCGWERDFDSPTQKDDFITDLWNKHVKESDTVIVIGDFGDPTYAEKLNGKKILVMGNHDWEWEGHKNYFDYVIPYPMIYNDFFILSHEPVYVSSHGVMANIYAHVHDNPNYMNFSPRGACVSAERISWMPIKKEIVLARMKEAAAC